MTRMGYWKSRWFQVDYSDSMAMSEVSDRMSQRDYHRSFESVKNCFTGMPLLPFRPRGRAGSGSDSKALKVENRREVGTIAAIGDEITLSLTQVLIHALKLKTLMLFPLHGPSSH
jgi:hypothetical protein